MPAVVIGLTAMGFRNPVRRAIPVIVSLTRPPGLLFPQNGLPHNGPNVPYYVTAENPTDKTYRPENFPQFERADPRVVAGVRHGEAPRQRSRGRLSQSEDDWANIHPVRVQ